MTKWQITAMAPGGSTMAAAILDTREEAETERARLENKHPRWTFIIVEVDLVA
jgi:hypothetical protein